MDRRLSRLTSGRSKEGSQSSPTAILRALIGWALGHRVPTHQKWFVRKRHPGVSGCYMASVPTQLLPLPLPLALPFSPLLFFSSPSLLPPHPVRLFILIPIVSVAPSLLLGQAIPSRPATNVGAALCEQCLAESSSSRSRPTESSSALVADSGDAESLRGSRHTQTEEEVVVGGPKRDNRYAS